MAVPSQEIDALKTETVWGDCVQSAYDDNGLPTFIDSRGQLIEGIYTDLPNHVYHSLDALSSSQLKKFAESPAHYYREYRSNIDRSRSLTTQRTFDTGSMGHELILEPEGFATRYFKLPTANDFPDALHTAKDLSEKCEEFGLSKSGSKPELILRLLQHDPDTPIYDVFVEDALRKGAGNAAVDAAIAASKKAKGRSSILRTFEDPSILALCNKTPLDSVLWDDAVRIANTARQHPYINYLIADGWPELTVISRDPETGLLLKCKFDWLRFDAISVDVKTSRSAAPEKFARQSKDLRYDIQQEFYKYVAHLQGIPVENFVFAVVEYLNADIAEPYELSDKDCAIGKSDCQRLLSEFKACDSADNWYGYTKGDRITVLELPNR